MNLLVIKVYYYQSQNILVIDSIVDRFLSLIYSITDRLQKLGLNFSIFGNSFVFLLYCVISINIWSMIIIFTKGPQQFRTPIISISQILI